MPFIENQEYRYADTQINWCQPGEVHVWNLYLPKSLQDIDLQLTYLSSEEKERAAKFYFAKDKVRFIQNRYLLRSIIARYMDIEISEVEFKYNKHGKPQLADDEVRLFFNISHSHDFTVLAFSKEYELGIDVELVKKEEDISYFINTDIFTPKEITMLKSQDGSNIPGAFYKLWSAKEAYVKALGIGLSIPLNTIETNITEENGIRLLNAKAESCKSHYLVELQNIHHDYIGTLALPEKTACIKYINNLSYQLGHQSN
jgi:4'-phosphopantetheinyl transferase